MFLPEYFVSYCLSRELFYGNYEESIRDLVSLERKFGFLCPINWGSCQARMRDVDNLVEKVEKNTKFSEAIPEFLYVLDSKIGYALGIYRSNSESEHSHDQVFDSERILFIVKCLLEDLLEVAAECGSSERESAHKVVVSALALLSFVYQYLIGCVDKGGSKTCSPGSFLFRLIFVAIVLFLGSYVWIKSRQLSFAANRRKRKSDVPGRVYRRAVKDTGGFFTHYKYEPRFKPLREKPESGISLQFNYLSLGSYKKFREAEIVRHIAAVLYGEEEGRPVQFEDGLCLAFPSVTDQEYCPPSGKEKAVWVTQKTKELYAELLQEKARRPQLLHVAVETVSYHVRDGEASRSDPSPLALGADSIDVKLACFLSPHGGNGVEEQVTSESRGSGQEPHPDQEEFSAFCPDSDFKQAISNLAFVKENDFPAIDDLNQIAGDQLKTDLLLDFESTLVPPQSSALDIPITATFPCLPQSDGVGDQGVESHLKSATTITGQQLESLPEHVQLEQGLTCQEQRPEEVAGLNIEKLLENERVRNSELQQKLRKAEVDKSELQQKQSKLEVQNSELQQELRKAEVDKSELQVENENIRSVVRQVAKLISASKVDGYPGDLQ